MTGFISFQSLVFGYIQATCRLAQNAARNLSKPFLRIDLGLSCASFGSLESFICDEFRLDSLGGFSKFALGLAAGDAGRGDAVLVFSWAAKSRSFWANVDSSSAVGVCILESLACEI